ncbi:Protein GID8 homolog, partial [Linum grandiflorum]
HFSTLRRRQEERKETKQKQKQSLFFRLIFVFPSTETLFLPKMMNTTPVNWDALDALVIDFATSENLIEQQSLDSPASPLFSPSPSPSSSSVSSSSYHSRLIIRQIRLCLESGNIDSGIHLLRAHAPSILDNHRLLFRLQKQKFIELLRGGTEEAREAALYCIRTALAPCALDAYPEAYEEFKHVLLALIYDINDQTSPVANEWSEKKRSEIAGLMTSVLRAHLHAYDPVFSMTLRYLISIHKSFCFRQGITSPISDLTERLLLEERDPPALPEESYYEAPPFDEVDIQALAHAVELTRQGAVDSLRFAKGNLFQAFQNELCRMKLDVSMVDELVREYCVYRGIIDSGFVSFAGCKVNQSEPSNMPSQDNSPEVDQATSKHLDGESCVITMPMDVHSENAANSNSIPETDTEVRDASESARNCADCSTSGMQQPLPSKLVQRNRNYTSGERSKRKRWRGRQDDQEYLAGVACTTCSLQDLDAVTTSTNIGRKHQGIEKLSTEDVDNMDDKYEILLRIKDLAARGMAKEVVEQINTLDPSFFSQNHGLLFQLKQVEFLKLVSAGDHSGALKVACSDMGPLASSDPSLLKPLKETLVVLLQPQEEMLGKGLPLNALSNALQVAIGSRLGIEEPQLMKLVRAAVHSHSEWFKLQKCKDRFENLMRIDSLKEADTRLLSVCSMSKLSNGDSCSSQVTTSSSVRLGEDGTSPTQDSSGDVCDETAILKVMEFLALPRADAIHLLAQYNGNAETVIQQIFA